MDSRFDETVKLLPPKKRMRVMELAGEGNGLLAGAGFGGGMINGFWYDCIRGEIIRFRRRMGLDKEDRYVNCMADFYIDARCGRAPRGELHRLADELILAICDDTHPCKCPVRKSYPRSNYDEGDRHYYGDCDEPTRRTAQQWHNESEAARIKKDEFRTPWILSEKKLKHRYLTPSSYVCYSCYQDKLATIPPSCGALDTSGADKDWLIKNTCNKSRGHTGKHWRRRSEKQFYW